MDTRAGIGNPRLITIILPAILLFSLILASGCAGIPGSTSTQNIQPVPSDTSVSTSWKETGLSDLHGRGNFSISRFAGKTVIVPVVSASCPSCIIQLNRQLAEINRLEKETVNTIVVVSLDLDPGGGPGFIASYGDPAGNTGYSARSPEAMTLELFHRFGPFAIDPATIPVILVCPDGRDLLLPPGVKTAESLNGSIAREC
jgi:hypothetical protein